MIPCRRCFSCDKLYIMPKYDFLDDGMCSVCAPEASKRMRQISSVLEHIRYLFLDHYTPLNEAFG